MTGIAPAIQLAHLDRLSPRVDVDGRPMLMTAIYADPPSYEPVVAPGEGIVCVDDVARAAVVYLDEHERTGSEHALAQARAALEFTMYMQDDDGRFVNFVTDLAGTKNRDGHTSRADLGWWGFRGMWALARGYRAFAGSDAAYAQRLLEHYSRSERALQGGLAADRGERIELRGRTLPGWLDRFPPDQAAVAVFALGELQEVAPDPERASTLATLAEGIRDAVVERGRDGAFGYAAQTAWTPELWHAWGAHSGEALARAGRVLRRDDLVDAARTEVEGLLAWQLAGGRIHELTPLPQRSGQQAYGVNAAVRASMELYRATGEERYAQMAGLHASWLFGNNMAGEAMYDAATGRGYDGIDDGRGVNRSSGAESTIEAIMALQSIAGTPEAERLARVRPLSEAGWQVVRAEALVDAETGAPPTIEGVPASDGRHAPRVPMARLEPGRTLRTTVDVPADGDYVLMAGIRRDVDGASPVRASIDGCEVATFGTRAAGGGSHVAFELGGGEPVRLTAGRHELELARTGDDPAPSHLQGVVLHPVRAWTELVTPDGARVVTSWDVQGGRLGIEQSPPA